MQDTVHSKLFVQMHVCVCFVFNTVIHGHERRLAPCRDVASLGSTLQWYPEDPVMTCLTYTDCG